MSTSLAGSLVFGTIIHHIRSPVPWSHMEKPQFGILVGCPCVSSPSSGARHRSKSALGWFQPQSRITPGLFHGAKASKGPFQIPDLENTWVEETVVHSPTFGAVYYAAMATGADGHTKSHQDSLLLRTLFPVLTLNVAAGLFHTLPLQLPSPRSAPGCHCCHCPAQALTVSLAVTFSLYRNEGCYSAIAGLEENSA